MKTNNLIDPDLFFQSPDPLMKNQPGSDRVTFRVLRQLLPSRYMLSGMAISFTLFLIPIGTLASALLLFRMNDNLMPVILSSSLFFCFYSLLLGFLIIDSRIPFLQEWKDKLGFVEE